MIAEMTAPRYTLEEIPVHAMEIACSKLHCKVTSTSHTSKWYLPVVLIKSRPRNLMALSKKSFIVQTLVVQLKIQIIIKLQMLLHHYQFLYKH